MMGQICIILDLPKISHLPEIFIFCTCPKNLKIAVYSVFHFDESPVQEVNYDSFLT